jgi:hypothetical protein
METNRRQFRPPADSIVDNYVAPCSHLQGMILPIAKLSSSKNDGLNR